MLTYDHRMGGGVPSLVESMAAAARHAGWEVEAFEFIKKANPFGPITRIDRSSVPSYGVPYVTSPLVEYGSYILPSWRLARHFRPGTLLVGVAGSNQTSIGLAIAGTPYYCWVSSTLRKEWRARRDFANLSLRGLRNVVNMVALARLHYAIEGWVYRRARHLFANSEYTRDSLIESYRLPPEKVTVLYPWIDTDLYNPQGPSVALQSTRYIFSAGRFVDRRKNLPLLIATMRELTKWDRLGDVQLLVAGELPSDDSHMALARREGVCNRITFLGRIPVADLASYYRHASAFVLTSRQEGLSLAVLEALASGVPVVSTRCGGPEELLRGPGVGILVEHDPQLCAAAIAKLMFDDNLRTSMGRSAREYAVANFTRNAFWRTFTKVMDDSRRAA